MAHVQGCYIPVQWGYIPVQWGYIPVGEFVTNCEYCETQFKEGICENSNYFFMKLYILFKCKTFVAITCTNQLYIYQVYIPDCEMLIFFMALMANYTTNQYTNKN